MSFQNYENFPGQQGQQDGAGAGPGGPPPQDPSQMTGQMMGGEAGQFQGGNGAPPPTAGGQPQEGDQKTTLWYVSSKCNGQDGIKKKMNPERRREGDEGRARVRVFTRANMH